ncbi:membrane-bound transcription factor site-2 protease-like isoform X2 [Macrosteles quadrilineatus]|uniref:membrane-bound transcription factor site-2 protease-like isoform X2 n=1 Tax=Macrosteles quadrilineatus TaxID=74068 RepID=UPI0023E2977B|nr:membrane-bound transcription factor site-2 protease-like isoform X2 [Macrosteles quadrilineatus]XP_054272134.1 membrane-bound transcription factor site-2 protease-like isoform X2 [Macrosteles quadrilineatus]
MKSCMHLPYLRLLNNTGLQVKPFRLHWYTTVFNRLIQKWGSTRPKLLLAWFSAGTWIAIVLMPIAVILLTRSIYILLKDLVQEEKSEFTSIATLQPLVPGLNIPISDLGYYLVTLLVCTVVHEMGHAIAAIREDGRVGGVGVVVFLCIPVAYVSLENLELLTPLRQLRVLCAGVWHNAVLALAAMCTLLVTPWLLLPLYDWGNGVQIHSIQLDSPVYGMGGLMEKDLVTKVNECVVTDSYSWQNCLGRAVRLATPGYCLQSEFIKEHDESVPAKHLSLGVVECCNSNAPRHLCFEYLEIGDEPLQLPQFSCLNARTVVEHSAAVCYDSHDCPVTLHCFRPSLENSTKLVTIRTKTDRTVLFLGHPAEVFHTVSVSDYTNLYALFPSTIPERIRTFCQYITSFSIGMALLNIIPCFYFDGQHIVRSLLDIYLIRHIEHASVRHAMSLCFTFIGTFILSLYLILALWSSSIK